MIEELIKLHSIPNNIGLLNDNTLRNREKEMFDLGLAAVDLSLYEWKGTINDEDHITEEELIKIGKDMEKFDNDTNLI